MRIKSNFAAGFYTCMYVVLFDISSQRERERKRERERDGYYTLIVFLYLFVLVCMLSYF